MNIFKNKH